MSSLLSERLFFCLKGIKAIEKGGLLFFSKRLTSSQGKYLAEFAIHSLNNDNINNDLSSCDNLTNANTFKTKQELFGRLFIKRSFWRRIAPFHVEFNHDENCWRALFEVDGNTLNELCWDDSSIVLCRFLVNETKPLHSEKELLEINQLIRKIILLIDRYPEFCMFVGNIDQHLSNSLAWYLTILLHGSEMDIVKNLSKLDERNAFLSMPSFENCISLLLEHLNKQDWKQVEQLSKEFTTEFATKLEELNLGQRKVGDGAKECGFLAMCRLAHNGHKGAMDLCSRFLRASIGQEDVSLVSDIALTDLWRLFTSTDLYTNIMLFLGELSVIEQNNDKSFDQLERESISKAISSLLAENPCFCFFPSYYDNNYVESNYCNDIAAKAFDAIFLSRLKNSPGQLEISNEIFFNATVLSKKGNKICNEFFQYFADNMHQSSISSLVWAGVSQLPISTIFQIYNQLQKDFEWCSTRVARMYITGIPDFLEPNVQYGFSELVNLSKSCSLAARKPTMHSLAHLYLGNVAGIPTDYEKALYWFSKPLSILYWWFPNEKKAYFNSLGVKIEHDEEYFMNL